MGLPSYAQTKYIYDILSALMHGKEIEFKPKLVDSWQSMNEYTKSYWDFQSYDFRIKQNDDK